MFILVIVLFFLVIVLPVILWSWFFSLQDRAEPEPRRLLNKVLMIGLGIGLLIGGIESLFFDIFFPGASELIGQNLIHRQLTQTDFLATLFFVFIAGFIEEYFKFVFLKMSVYNKTAFNQVADGVIYAVTLALGFATIENISYFLVLAKTQTTSVFITSTVIRAVLTLLMHLTATGIIGYHLGKAKFSADGRRLILVKGVIIAALFHGAFNIMVSIPQLSFLSIVMVIVVFVLLIQRMRTREAQMVWRLVWPKQEGEKLPN